ncbi:cyclic nucleotide-binding domain-containing protein [Oceanicoccus sagamiensis]|uniref:Protein kinase n=1 Tax=Oceanicoccus sagamiensis TaxID=716816 RepID=A0A1X9ND27_9GAMM|nr:cyclic nucleotide-binding domain-containing protein [Oceanicoccus sagamiensis]ARN75948.1 protein kinase [Oceanicoccus sagamiensis]
MSHSITSHIEQRLLQTLVPVNSLTVDHLNTLLRDQSIEMLCSGQTLFSTGEYDNHHIYLLSGQLELVDSLGSRRQVSAEDPACRYALDNHQPRRSTAVALSDCTVIRFNSDQLDAMLAWDQASHYIMLDIAAQRDLDEDADWMVTLLKSNLFYKVPPMNIRQILGRFEAQVVSSGETVLRQGELGDCCYFIKEGIADVYQAVDDKSPSERVAELGVGRFFGEDALVNDTARNATITMQTNGVLMRLDKQDFYLLLRNAGIKQLNLSEAKEQFTDGATWIDVRTQDEYEKGHSEAAINMPLNLLKLKSRMLDKNTPYIVYCNSGRRSEAAAYLLGEEGFDVSALVGGYKSYAVDQQRSFESV